MDGSICFQPEEAWPGLKVGSQHFVSWEEIAPNNPILGFLGHVRGGGVSGNKKLEDQGPYMSTSGITLTPLAVA